MQMSADLEAAFSEQITLELASSIAYLQLSADLSAADLPGMASWMRVQADEERRHAQKFANHVLDRGNTVRVGAIEAPQQPSGGPIAAFEAALAHEQRVSESIRRLYRQAADSGDLDSLPLLSWFITEQVEEEATVSEILGRLRRVGDDGSALVFLDSELGTRPPEAP